MRDRKMQDCDKQYKTIFKISFKTNCIFFFYLFWRFLTVSCLNMIGITDETSVFEQILISIETFHNFTQKSNSRDLLNLQWLVVLLQGWTSFSFCIFKNRFFVINWNDFHNTLLGDAQTKIKPRRPLNKMNCPKLSEMVYLLFIEGNLSKTIDIMKKKMKKNRNKLETIYNPGNR